MAGDWKIIKNQEEWEQYLVFLNRTYGLDKQTGWPFEHKGHPTSFPSLVLTDVSPDLGGDIMRCTHQCFGKQQLRGVFAEELAELAKLKALTKEY